MKEILKNNEKELTTVCEPLTKDDTTVIEDVLKTFKGSSVKCIGLGLAANQIGHTKRFIVMSATADLNDILSMCNPVIVNHGKDIEEDIEACLSKPGKIEKIKRYRVIDVEYYTLDWIKVTETFKGLKARIIQHELDHLNGLDCLTNRL